jgi:transposase
MQKTSAVAPVAAIGLDVGDRFTYVCAVDRDGEIVRELRVATTPQDLAIYFTGKPRCLVVLEVGTHSPWISRLIERLGHEVIVANARRLRLIAESDRKTDRVDARILAELGRTRSKLLLGVQHRSEQTQADLTHLRSRDLLVRMRTKLVNRLRGALKTFGVQPPRSDASCFHRRVRAVIPPILTEALQPMLDLASFVETLIRTTERKLARVATERYPVTAVLRQVDRVGPVTSLTYALTIEDPRRFRKSRAVGAYCGLAPKRRDSGNTRSQLGITKAGSHLLRRCLVQCGQQILSTRGQDSDLRRFGQAICARGGGRARKRAVTAIARKLAVLLHRLWVSGETYDPLRQAKRLAAAA